MVKNYFKEQCRIVTEIIPIILIGGSGRRLWPISRQNYPKQFLPLVNETSMLQDTVNRIQDLDNLSKEIIVVCNEEHKHIVSKPKRCSWTSTSKTNLVAPNVVDGIHHLLADSNFPLAKFNRAVASL